jgi:hypothetical protein
VAAIVALWHWLRGRVHVRTFDGKYHWMASHHVIAIENIFRPTHLWHIFPTRRVATEVEDGTAPVVGNFMRAYTPVWSFFINNVIVALSTALGFEVRLSVDTTQTVGFFIIFGITFLTGFAIMFFFFYLFGFGEAMLAPRRPKVLSHELSNHALGKSIPMESNEYFVVTETNQFYGPRLKFNYVSRVYLDKP